MLRSKIRRAVGQMIPKDAGIRNVLKSIDNGVQNTMHSLGEHLPILIRPQAEEIFISLTAHCNLRCIGCKYGRDFMPRSVLPWELCEPLLEDAADLGYTSIRLYGGEPLLHPDLDRIIATATDLNLNPWVTTNGMLLEKKVAGMVDAGLKNISLGFYGIGDEYNNYVQRADRFDRFESAVAHVATHYREKVELTLSWLLMEPTCSLEALHGAWNFALKYEIPMFVNVVHYSLPYFAKGPEDMRRCYDIDRDRIQEIVDEIIDMKRDRPDLLMHTEPGIRSIPDWLLKREEMRVPCDRYNMIWVGPDGSVQLCYVTFPFGNLKDRRLKEMLFGPEHNEAARKCMTLDCPNCHCGYNARVEKHGPTRQKYAAMG